MWEVTAAVATVLHGTLSASGATDLSGTLSITGAAVLKSTLSAHIEELRSCDGATPPTAAASGASAADRSSLDGAHAGAHTVSEAQRASDDALEHATQRRAL